MKEGLSSRDTLVEDVFRYLGGTSVEADSKILHCVEQALDEVEHDSTFQYVYASYVTLLDFLRKPVYQEYLSGSTGYLLCATTLGVQVDNHIKRLQLTDMSFALIYDAAASAYLEYRADLFEKDLPFDICGARFCPGYGGSSVEDNRNIATAIRTHRIGISFLDSGLMIPMKSMMGIVRLGGVARKSCHGCVAFDACSYRTHNMTCWK